MIVRRPPEYPKKRKYKSPYLEPVPPIRLAQPLSNAALSLLMEIYYFSYISEDRLTQNGRMALAELERNNLAHLSTRGDPFCQPNNFPYRETKKLCRFAVLGRDGMKYAHWIEVQTGKHAPHITPSAMGLQDYFGLRV